MTTEYATYCPEDNKLRLYVGRVPRDEYEALRAEGWTSTPKQSCDFVATWTPARLARAFQYSEGGIEDEDQSPADRAADRAERFNGYLHKRTTEAVGHAETYSAGPSAHGYQSQQRAERAAARHDRITDKASDAWGKAEYWQRRTAGVIANALYKSEPGVRMGRIKVLEADLRRMTEGSQWHTHTTLRLAYENQMLEAQGGRAAHVEMIPGGFFQGAQIYKVNKSTVTGRVVSVAVRVPRVTGWHYGIQNVPHTDYALMQIETERLPISNYRPPTDEELAAFLAARKAEKAAKPKADTIPLVNPTDADAERLQALFNAKTLADREAMYKRQGYSLPVTDCKPQAVLRMTQAHYSQLSGGTYTPCQTREVFPGGIECESYYGAAQKMRALHGRAVCKIRRTSGESYGASRVIVITDKPQKPFPLSVWEAAPQVSAIAA